MKQTLTVGHLAAEGARRAATVMLRERLDGVAVVIEETEPVS